MRTITFILLLSLQSLVFYGQIPLTIDRQQAEELQPKPIKTAFRVLSKDEKTGIDLTASYQIQAVLARKKYSGSSTPKRPFQFTLDRTDTLIVTTRAAGYLEMEEVLYISCDTCANYEHVALMEKKPDRTDVFSDLKVNDKIRLDNVYFDQSSYILRPESYPQLDKLVNTLNANPRLKIEIAGHTDNVGDRRLNQALSENRARVIVNYLRTKGIPENRLRWVGYGDSRPSVANENEAGRKKNRRVEFMVLEN